MEILESIIVFWISGFIFASIIKLLLKRKGKKMSNWWFLFIVILGAIGVFYFLWNYRMHK